MDTLFKIMNGFIIMMIEIMVGSVLTLGEIQIMSARHLHTSVINQIQSSYYAVNDTELNQAIQAKMPGWYVETKTVNSVADRQDRLVTLHYKVYIPLLGIEKDGQIDGYAR